MSFIIKDTTPVARDRRSLPGRDARGGLWSWIKPNVRRVMEETAYRCGMMGVVARRYNGPGIVLMFHEIHDDVDGELRTGCDAGQLRRVLSAVRAAGRDFVTPQEALARLATPNPRPFALLTFDDAYRDNWTTALPVLEDLDVPMTLFVPTGMLTREINAWWLVLRTVLKQEDTLPFEPMSTTFACADLDSKVAALHRIMAWLGASNARMLALTEALEPYKIDRRALVEQYAMDENELKRMARHKLVTIGAHTTTHRFLADLDEREVYEELRDNKAYLERLIDRPVDYLAYPYGTVAACSEREAELAKRAGFKAAFSTRHGHLFPAHLETPQFLPRFDFGFAGMTDMVLQSRITGFHRAIATRWGNPVATFAD
jgi:peptidoglycan/xylan/chitin deacetylase (PgdA/CDA1 family)